MTTRYRDALGDEVPMEPVPAALVAAATVGQVVARAADGTLELVDPPEGSPGGGGGAGNPALILLVGDETTPLTTGAAKLTFRMPYGMALTDVRASVATAPTGAGITVDINAGGVSIISTPITIDDGDESSTDAATPPVIADPDLADGVEVTIDIDGVGSSVAGAGLKVYFIGTTTGAGGATGIYDPFAPEASPSAQDEDFDTDLSLWTQVSWTGHTADVNTTKPGALYVKMQASMGAPLKSLMQVLPSGDFVFCVPFEILTRGGNYPYVAAILSNGVTAGAGSQVVNAIVAQTPFAQNQYIQNFAGWQFSGSISDNVGYGRSDGWLRWRRSGTTYFAGISPDGRKWIEQTVTVGFTPTHFGVGFANSSGVDCYVTVPCARFISGVDEHLFGGLV